LDPLNIRSKRAINQNISEQLAFKCQINNKTGEVTLAEGFPNYRLDFEKRWFVKMNHTLHN